MAPAHMVPNEKTNVISSNSNLIIERDNTETIGPCSRVQGRLASLNSNTTLLMITRQDQAQCMENWPLLKNRCAAFEFSLKK